MRQIFFLAVVAACACAITACQHQEAETVYSEWPVEVFFSPDSGATEVAVAEIGSAQTKILVHACCFSLEPVAQALIEARDRGVPVNVIVGQEETAEHFVAIDRLRRSGIAVRVDSQPGDPNKFLVIDSRTVLTGSLRAASSADDAIDNLLVIRDEKIAEKYAAQWRSHAERGEVVDGQGGGTIAGKLPSRDQRAERL